LITIEEALKVQSVNAKGGAVSGVPGFNGQRPAFSGPGGMKGKNGNGGGKKGKKGGAGGEQP
jgi:hypothetical protein